MVILAICVASVLLLGVIVWIGTNMVAHPDPAAGAVGAGIGSGLGMFDPGAGRAREEIDDKANQTEVLPTPDEDEDHPVWKVDLRRGTVKIPRPPQ
ncbi:hypothetical protein [Nocardioides conyzicola]|uniref:Uncharacterized protein n=1 Tax=Nocardioides conyzicola TaxID=1651781 RepID=A0ABP8WJB6_9ACTN